LALVALAAVGVAGCESSGGTSGASSAASAPRQPTTTDASRSQPPSTTHADGTLSGRRNGVFLRVSVPPSRSGDCQPLEVLGIVQELTDAIASDPALAASFAKDDFQWYSASENGSKTVRGRHAAVYDTAGFRAYLERRRSHHERLRLIALRVGDDGNFEVRLVRGADDLPSGQGGSLRVAEGKGKVDCTQRSIVAFSHAMFPVEPAYGTWREAFGDASAEQFRAAAAAAHAALGREP
jgi:hypothetical protein